MALLSVRNLAYLRNIPVFGARLYEALQDIQQGVGAGFEQGNLNPNGQPDAPPNIQGLNVTAQDGHFHFQITDQASQLRRGVQYRIEHADNPSFINPHQIVIGDTRNHDEYLGNVTRYFRAYSSYAGSPASQPAYHGGQSTPLPVTGGGPTAGPAFLPSQGAGTGAAGQGGLGPGPVPIRTDVSGFDWRLQRAQGLAGGFVGTGSPGSQGGIGSGGGSGGGGGGIVTQPLIVDTHANRLANYPSVRYPVNIEFYESDRTVFYWVQNASGTVTVTTGTTVTWNSGNHFINTGSGFTAAQWPAGTQIIINGVTCHVASVTNSTTLTLQVATVNAGPVSYLVPSGRWVYLEGQYSAALASLPSDLGENETILVSAKVALGFLYFENAVYAHQLQWNVSAWQRGPNDEEHSDEFHDMGSAPTDIGWHACDGSTVAYLKYDGTTANRALPNSDGTPAYAKGGSTYSPTLNAPVAPTFAGGTSTPAGTVSSVFTGTPQTFTTTPALAGAGVNAFTAPNPYTPAGTVASVFTGTPGAITGAISLPGDPIENFAVIRVYRR